MTEPKTGERYRHFKGKEYEIVAVATHAETEETMVVYRALYGDNAVYVRPLGSFAERLDKAKYPEAQQEHRFERVSAGKSQPPEQVNAGEGEVDPKLLAFLNADTYKQKIEVLNSIRDNVTDKLIDAFAAASDLEIKQGDVQERFEELKGCLSTYARFECDRLR